MIDFNQLIDNEFVVLAIMALTGILFVFRKQFSIIGKPQYKAIKYLNTRTEQRFLLALWKVLPEHLYVAQKVRLADVTLPRNSKNIKAFNQVSRKHLDFVLVDKSTSKIICAIELDDRSHLNLNAKKRDKIKNHALSSAGVKLHRVKVGSNYPRAIDDILVGITQAKKFNDVNSTCCPRCRSLSYKRVDMKWPNKGKHYSTCSDCAYQSNVVNSTIIK